MLPCLTLVFEASFVCVVFQQGLTFLRAALSALVNMVSSVVIDTNGARCALFSLPILPGNVDTPHTCSVYSCLQAMAL